MKTILAAVDFGEASTRALQLASELARALGATLRVLHAEALDAPPYFTPAQIEVIEGAVDVNRARAGDYLRHFVAAHVAGPFETVIEVRAATEAILHASEGVDLVVMGTHGRRGPSRWWLGSVAERVLRETRVPLLVVQASGNAPPAAATFQTGMLMQSPQHPKCPVTHRIAESIARACGGATFRQQTDDPAMARQAGGATWVAVPMPMPASARWLAHVGEPLVKGCAVPVLFVPETEEERPS